MHNDPCPINNTDETRLVITPYKCNHLFNQSFFIYERLLHIMTGE